MGTHDDLRERSSQNDLDIRIQVLFIDSLGTLQEHRDRADLDLRDLCHEEVHVLYNL